jgi:hypothetical protein
VIRESLATFRKGMPVSDSNADYNNGHILKRANRIEKFGFLRSGRIKGVHGLCDNNGRKWKDILAQDSWLKLLVKT